jgi:phosphoribosyl-ATP pyrophosphohydrolase/phosphoribosyl-AMP cyclohydrolase
MNLATELSSLKWGADGLMPAVLQDAQSKEVLMLGYMNEESLSKTLESGEAWFYSRSRQELWHKGATSGHTQQVVSITTDCDQDTLLVKVLPNGPACHTGQYTCFNESVASVDGNESGAGEAGGQELSAMAGSDRHAIFNDLEALIAKRETERPEGSYTTYLFEKGVDKILKKVGEEAGEVIIAAKNRSHDELRYEASDLLFHLMVLFREQQLPWDEVLRELKRRYHK